MFALTPVLLRTPKPISPRSLSRLHVKSTVLFAHSHSTSGFQPARGLFGPSIGTAAEQRTSAPIMRLLQKTQFSTVTLPLYQLTLNAMLPPFTNAQLLNEMLPVARFAVAE